MRLLIIDDHPVVVTGCRAIFAGRADVETFAAYDGEAGVAAYFELRADLALVDVNLPDLSGFEVLRRIVARDRDARLIGFSMNADPAVAVRTLEAGARAYLTKADPPECLIDAAQALLAGGTYLTPETARDIAFIRERALSAREDAILAGLREGLGLADIAAGLGVSYKTVAANAVTLKAKLGARTTQDLVRIAVTKARL